MKNFNVIRIIFKEILRAVKMKIAMGVDRT